MCINIASITGGANPAIRTLFYRLVRLMSLSIVPIFVFDGPHKPLFKRNKRSRGPGDSVSVAMAKRLFRLFGFHIHDAPGEAEAECALLQQQGIVDAVLSEDVDTIMFGCTRTLRNWSAEGARTAKTPTHVSVYDSVDLRQGEIGLDREGMVLVAMMSGGDYLPEGVPGCGIKVACEAAKAGFGESLCRIKRSDPNAASEWRECLMRELRTNESKFFRVRHKALTIPEEFPDMDVLRYYTNPVVSQAETIEKLRREFPSKKEIDIIGLREFTAETFDWTYKIGAVKFIRVLAPSLLIQGLLDLGRDDIEPDNPDVREAIEGKLIKTISKRRTHFTTDATPELRVSYIPNDIVNIDLDIEEDEVPSSYCRSGLALNSDDEAEEQLKEGEENGPRMAFDPLQPDLIWVPESIAKLGIPLMVEYWEGKQRWKKQVQENKAPAKRLRKKTSDMPTGALKKWVKTTKAGSTIPPKEPVLPLSFSQHGHSQYAVPVTRNIKPVPTKTTRSRPSRDPKATSSSAHRPSLDVNPWSIMSSQITPKTSRTDTVNRGAEPQEAILISSSPVRPSPSPSPVVPIPAAIGLRHGQSFHSPTFLPIDDNHIIRTPLNDSFDLDTSPLASKPSPELSVTPSGHTQSLEETIRKPVKYPQRSRVTAAARGHSLATRPTRSRRATQEASQISIKNFGRNSEAMGKKNMASEPKSASPVDLSFSDSEDEFEDVRAIGSRKPSDKATDLPAPPTRSGVNKIGNAAAAIRTQSGSNRSTTSTATITTTMEMLSSPTPDSPFATTGRSDSGKTRVYTSRTSDVGFGYFQELEVSREEADRIMSQHQSDSSKRPGGRRMWRESEVTILDLTNED